MSQEEENHEEGRQAWNEVLAEVGAQHEGELEIADAEDEANEESLSTFGGELSDFVAQTPEAVVIAPAVAGSQDEQFCHETKQAVMRYYGASIIAEYLQGKYLFLLQQERSKPGSGTFVADLAQLREAGALGLSNATAYRRIAQYKLVSDGLADLLPVCLSQAEKDQWGLDELTVDAFDLALERNQADESTKAYKDLIGQVKQQHKEHFKQNGGMTTLNLQLFGLTDDDKKRFRKAFDALVDSNGKDKIAASKHLVNMVCLFVQGSKGVAA